MNATTKLVIVEEALRAIIRGCETRLKKGHDNGDAETLRIAQGALKHLTGGN